MNHATKSLIEYIIFGIGIGIGLFICFLPFLANDSTLPKNFLFAGKLTPAIGVLLIIGTFAWGYWAHQQCKKGVCEIAMTTKEKK